MLVDMDLKKLRHFLCGLLLGAAAMHWYVVSAEETLDVVMTWLQDAADEYRATHPTSEVDAGWRPRRAKDR
jgi:hypothetical protein